MDVQFVHHIGAMGLRGFHADAQQYRDFLGGLPLRHQLQHLAFAITDRFFRKVIFPEKRLHDRAGDALGQKHLSPAYGAKRLDQLTRGLRLQHVSGYAGAQALQDQVIFGMHGKQDDFCPRIGFDDLPRGVNAVQKRHRQVKDRNFRMMGLAQFHGLAPVWRFRHHFKSFSLQKHPQPLTDHLVIVSQHDPNCHLDTSSGPGIQAASHWAEWLKSYCAHLGRATLYLWSLTPKSSVHFIRNS